MPRWLPAHSTPERLRQTALMWLVWSGRTVEQWRLDNSEYLQHRRQQYEETNKQKPKECYKKYRENNKEKVKQTKQDHYIRNKNKVLEKKQGVSTEKYNIERLTEYRQEYRECHKDEIAQKRLVSIECQCGAVVRKCNIRHHERTTKHQQYIKSLE